MAKKKQTDKEKAHMYFKWLKAGMKVSNEQMRCIERYYPFMRD